MLSFPRRQFVSIAAAGIVVALLASIISVRADELVQNLGPVGPHEPILTTVGSKSIIAFYSQDRGNCAVHVVVWNSADVNAESTTGFQTTLNPGQMAPVNTAEHESLYLQCGDDARRLAIVPTAEFFAVGITKQTGQN
jgi:hypothetical protein